MHNELLKIGNITIYGYGLMIAIGVIMAYLVTEYRAKKQGLDSDPVFAILIIGVVSGFLGAKLLYFITILDEIIANPSLLWTSLADGFVVYGGVIAGILAANIYCKIKKLHFLSYLDAAAPSIALAQGFGRIGCFLAGCCYGHESHLPIAVTFKNSSYAPNGIPLFHHSWCPVPLTLYTFLFYVRLHAKIKHREASVLFTLFSTALDDSLLNFSVAT